MPSDQSEQIHLRHAPVRDWILSALLSLVCLLIGCSLFWLMLRLLGDTDNADFTLLLFGAAVAAVAASLFVGRYCLTSAVSEVKIDLANQWVEVTRYRFYGKRRDRYHFHQIEKFRSYKAKRFLSSRSSSYSLELILINRKKVRIRVTIGSVQAETTKFIKSLNKTLRQSKSSVARTLLAYDLTGLPPGRNE